MERVVATFELNDCGLQLMPLAASSVAAPSVTDAVMPEEHTLPDVAVVTVPFAQ